jgi:hypothetical protein
MRRLTLLGPLVVALSGCGVADDRADVRKVTGNFVAALHAGQGAVACAQLDPQTRIALAGSAKKPCVHAITSIDPPRGALQDVRVYAFSAIVQFSSNEALFLSKGSAGWLISALGCKPEAQATRHPYDCEVEG